MYPQKESCALVHTGSVFVTKLAFTNGQPVTALIMVGCQARLHQKVIINVRTFKLMSSAHYWITWLSIRLGSGVIVGLDGEWFAKSDMILSIIQLFPVLTVLIPDNRIMGLSNKRLMVTSAQCGVQQIMMTATIELVTIIVDASLGFNEFSIFVM